VVPRSASFAQYHWRLHRLQIFFLLALPSAVQKYGNGWVPGGCFIILHPKSCVLSAFRLAVSDQALSCCSMTSFRSFPRRLFLIAGFSFVRNTSQQFSLLTVSPFWLLHLPCPRILSAYSYRLMVDVRVSEPPLVTCVSKPCSELHIPVPYGTPKFHLRWRFAVKIRPLAAITCHIFTWYYQKLSLILCQQIFWGTHIASAFRKFSLSCNMECTEPRLTYKKHLRLRPLWFICFPSPYLQRLSRYPQTSTAFPIFLVTLGSSPLFEAIYTFVNLTAR
jgi:hypothetical protein